MESKTSICGSTHNELEPVMPLTTPLVHAQRAVIPIDRPVDPYHRTPTISSKPTGGEIMYPYENHLCLPSFYTQNERRSPGGTGYKLFLVFRLVIPSIRGSE